MKGSTYLIAVLLILILVASLAYMNQTFFFRVIGDLAQFGTDAIAHATVSLLADVKIDSLGGSNVYIRNIGKVGLTNLAVFVNDVIDSEATFEPESVPPGGISIATLAYPLNSGDVIIVTTDQGASTTRSVP